jgi:hypothetical protein
MERKKKLYSQKGISSDLGVSYESAKKCLKKGLLGIKCYFATAITANVPLIFNGKLTERYPLQVKNKS